MIRIDAPNPTATNPDSEATFASSLPWVRAEAERLAQRLPPSAEYDADELFQVGCIAAWKLAREWDKSRSLFRTFAQSRVIGAMIDLVREAAACGFSGAVGARRRIAAGEPIRVKSLSVRLSRNGDEEFRGEWRSDLVAERDAEITDGDAAELASIVRRESGGASADELRAAGLYFAAGRTMRMVGQEMGLSESRVSQMIGGVVDRIRERLASRGRTRYTAFA